jgi:hypothetical protein
MFPFSDQVSLPKLLPVILLAISHLKIFQGFLQHTAINNIPLPKISNRSVG